MRGRRAVRAVALATVVVALAAAALIGVPTWSVAPQATAAAPAMPGNAARPVALETLTATPSRSAAQTTTFGPGGRPAAPAPVF